MIPAHADQGQPTWATQDDDGLVKQPHPLRLPLRHVPVRNAPAPPARRRSDPLVSRVLIRG